MEWQSNYKRVWAVYFSATGATKKVVVTIANTVSSKISTDKHIISCKSFDFTTPCAREESLTFSKEDIVIFGCPVYAGRLPNLMLDYIKSINGNGALAVPIVLFGNRGYDDALIELRDILEAGGFRTIAAGAFVGEHSFSNKIAAGRPNDADLQFAADFGVIIAEKLKVGEISRFDVPGVPLPYRGYYQPRDARGEPIDIRKVKPQTNVNCDSCGLCVGLCPMGAIDSKGPASISGVCIKCCACVKYCPNGAKSFTDSGYLYHVEDLERKLFSVYSANEIF